MDSNLFLSYTFACGASTRAWAACQELSFQESRLVLTQKPSPVQTASVTCEPHESSVTCGPQLHVGSHEALPMPCLKPGWLYLQVCAAIPASAPEDSVTHGLLPPVFT